MEEVRRLQDLQEQLQSAVQQLQEQGAAIAPRNATSGQRREDSGIFSRQGISAGHDQRMQIAASGRNTSTIAGNTEQLSSTSQHATNSRGLSSLFNWNPGSLVGRKRPFQKHPTAPRRQKKRTAKWTHNFVCLASTQSQFLPDGAERSTLQIAGLGEKKITFDAFADSQEIYYDLLSYFPQLRDAGGFELMRTSEGGGKQLEVIATPDSGYDVPFLKAVVHHAKIYIRPLQNNLSLSPLKKESILEPLKVDCKKCGELIVMSTLREHMSRCSQSSSAVDINNDDNPMSTSISDQNYDPIIIDPPETKAPSPITTNPVPDSISSDDHEDSDELDPVLEVALHLSKDEQHECSNISEIEPQMLGDLVERMQREIDENSIFEMVVRRSNILGDALRRMEKTTFDPCKKLHVVFVGEDGVDTGGLTREFFRLTATSFSQKYLEPTGCFKRNAIAYQEGLYSRLGKLAAMSLVHGGGSFRLFSNTVFNFLCGRDAAELLPSIEEVADMTIKDFLYKVQATTKLEEFSELAMDNIEILDECGFGKPITRLKLTDKPDLVQAVALHRVLLKSLAETTQFREGLSTLNVQESLEKYPKLFVSYYCRSESDVLNSDMLRKLFTDVSYSSRGSSARIKEETAFMYFVDYLDDCEGVDAVTQEAMHEVNADDNDENCASTSDDSAPRVSLKMVLAFFTGADSIPPVGYNKVTLSFNHQNPYPTSSTCGLELTLPTKYDDYDEFKRNVDVGFTMHGGFGLC